jgi:hypothetical protein
MAEPRWSIRLPFRSETDPVSSVADAARALPREEREVVREVALHLATERGCRTVGDALSTLDRMAPGGRRELLDRARARAGLEPTAEVDAHERYAATQRQLVLRGDIDVPLRLSPSGAVVEDDPAEAERARQETESRARRYRQRQAARKLEAEKLRAEEEARREAERRELPAGFAPTGPTPEEEAA